jgi:four helix bundle protein
MSPVYSFAHHCSNKTRHGKTTTILTQGASNTAEGFERETQKDCIKFLTYAKGSCGELRCQIYIGMDIEYIPKDVGKKWIQETIEISSMLSGLIKTKRGFLKNSLASFIALFL